MTISFSSFRQLTPAATALRSAALALLLTALSTTPALSADDIIIADFEGETYGPWVKTGEAFGPGPCTGPLPNQGVVLGFVGKSYASSYHGEDRATGTLTSPPFTIERPFITFRIGGGKFKDKSCLNLLVDGAVVRQAVGTNYYQGGSSHMEARRWDVSDLVGKKAVIQILDNAGGVWQHITVDHLVQTDRQPAVVGTSRTMLIERRYLQLPICSGGLRYRVLVRIEGQPEVHNNIQITDGPADFLAFLDVSQYIGQKVTFDAAELPDGSSALGKITQSDSLVGEESMYREPLRGQFHFSARRGWINDPNGLVFFNGEYHLFYQHNPYGIEWGNMHWGHAVSRDLLHWQELPIALSPDNFGTMYSGCAVVDWNNTSGLGEAGKPPLVLIYTASDTFVQCIASSTDGRTFRKHAGNPVLRQITPGNRDPKVMWHQESGRWVMALYVEEPGAKHTVRFLTSPNLRDWTPASSIAGGAGGDGYLYECPDLFPILLEGKVAEAKWVLTGANDQHAIGRFDGSAFTPEHSRLPGHRGKGFYAAQTFSDIPTADGRRIQIGHFQTPTLGMPFNQTMTIPLELTLIGTADGPRLAKNPVRELAALRKTTRRVGAMTLRPGDEDPLAGMTGELVELRTEFEPDDAAEVVFTIRGATILYDAKKQELTVNHHLRVPAPLRDGRQRLIVYCDRMGLEIFASDGLTYIPLPFIPKVEDGRLGVGVNSGTAKIIGMQVHELGSIWK